MRRRHRGARFDGNDDAVSDPNPECLRGEMAPTERPGAVEPDAGIDTGRCGADAPEVAEPMDKCRSSSGAEQLIRKEPPAAPTKTQHDANPDNPTQPV
jgi:hypothetical protein